ncbi:MAG: carboxypeptidase-like regulatory domain-containing protein [Omnitrophica WOR_2 bacterium]
MKKNSSKLILILVLLLNANFLFAQAHKITGIVYDSDTKDGIPGVTIIEKGTQNGTITDIDGKFSISVASENSVLVVSFIGYQTQDIPIAKRSIINVNLQQQITDLSEIVVIGYGTQQKKVVTDP